MQRATGQEAGLAPRQEPDLTLATGADGPVLLAAADAFNRYGQRHDFRQRTGHHIDRPQPRPRMFTAVFRGPQWLGMQVRVLASSRDTRPPADGFRTG